MEYKQLVEQSFTWVFSNSNPKYKQSHADRNIISPRFNIPEHGIYSQTPQMQEGIRGLLASIGVDYL
jgi:hypothetical protein